MAAMAVASLVGISCSMTRVIQGWWPAAIPAPDVDLHRTCPGKTVNRLANRFRSPASLLGDQRGAVVFVR